MAVPIEFMRGVLGLLCVFFAFYAGRSASAVRNGRQRQSKLYAWVLRTIVCGAALLFRHAVDGVVIGVYTLAALAAAAGVWDEQRPRKVEDLSHEIVPKDEE